VTNLAATKKEPRLTEAEYAVLGLLADGQSSGYDLSKRAEGSVDLILAPTKSRIYVALSHTATSRRSEDRTSVFTD